MAVQSNIDRLKVEKLIEEIEKKKERLMKLADDSNNKMKELQKVYEGEASDTTVKSVGLTAKEVEDYVDAIIMSLKKNAGIQVQDYQAQDTKNAESATTSVAP